MSKTVLCLSIYSAACTIIIAVLSYIIAQDISCSLVTEVSGTDNKVKTQNNYEFLSFDNRRRKDGTYCNCDTTWSYYGVEAFEYFALVMFLIFILYKGGKKICGKKGLIEKRRNSKEQRDAAKFEKLRSKYEKTEATKKTETTEPEGHVTNGNQGAVQAPKVTELKQLPPFVYA